jgi:acetyl-CoA carboxylase biotin carboxyl carrier protein
MDQEAFHQLERLLRLFQEHGLAELVVEDGGVKVRLRGPRAQTNDESARPPATKAAPAREPAGPRRQGRTVAVRSPLIGTFYRAATPDSPTFVEIDDMVERGQTVCIVEAMKVFNEIKAEWSGKVVAIPAEDGKLVQAGEPLIVLEFLAGSESQGGQP